MVAHKSDSDQLVQNHFFEALGIKQKGPEEKIHLFYDVLKDTWYLWGKKSENTGHFSL